MNYPPITIVMTTFIPTGDDGDKRILVEDAALQTWADNLKYRGKINLHIADDGSVKEGIHIPNRWMRNLDSLSYSSQSRKGVGASLNAGFRKAFETSPLAIYLADDWSLIEPLDLTPWAQLLMEREDVGVVRFSPPHPSIRGSVEAFTTNLQSWGLRLDRYGYAYGHRPALHHKRFWDAYGEYAEKCTALECEDRYNLNYCSKEGPDVILTLPSKFEHLSSVELAYVNPGGE